MDHEIDILVCTTIIETGVDVPNCNTLIIELADKMGLSRPVSDPWAAAPAGGPMPILLFSLGGS